MRRVFLFSLLSLLTLSASAATTEATPDVVIATAARPVSTGVTSPRLVRSSRIRVAENELPASSLAPSVALKFTLDQTGTPQNIQIVQPLTQAIDARVIEAVRQFRWTPAVLNNQTVAIDMNLTVQVQRAN